MERPEAAEGRPRQVEVEDREGEFEGDIDADQESGEAPEHRCDHPGADDVVHVAVGRGVQRGLQRDRRGGGEIDPAELPGGGAEGDQPDEAHMEGEEPVIGGRGGEEGEEGDEAENCSERHRRESLCWTSSAGGTRRQE